MRSGINIGTLRNWEQGRNEPQIEIVARLIAVLGTHAQPLLERLGVEASQFEASELITERVRLRPKAQASKKTGKDNHAHSGKLQRKT